jgi:hypothetical protein
MQAVEKLATLINMLKEKDQMQYIGLRKRKIAHIVG